MSIENKYQKLSDIDHVLKRSGMYISSTSHHSENRYLLNSNNKFELNEIEYIPGFIKLFDEIITNSVDESKRKGSKLNTIKVTVDNSKIIVMDNGGIPVVKHKEHNEWIPEMVFSNLKAGSNFDDSEERLGGGLHGMGSVLTNIFSTEFYISTCDGKKRFEQTFSNNMRKRTSPKITSSNKNHTIISYIPDYEKFGMSNLDEIHLNIIKKRVYDVAGCNPKLKVYFNDEEIKIKSFQDYIKYYIDDCFYEEDKRWSIGIGLSKNGFQHVSFVNSVETYIGGTHVDYITNQIVSQLREYFSRKHKVDIKPSDLKNHIFLFINSTIINPSFSSQTKEKLITETKNFGSEYSITNKTIQLIIKSEIVESVLDWIQRKKEADDNKLARELNKNLSKLKVEKLVDAKGKERMKCELLITEGDSASSSFRKYRNPETQGCFSLRGKFINAIELTNKKLVENNEVVNLMGSLGLQLGYKPDFMKMRYGKIYLNMDKDVDGNSIAGLLINFLFKYWPELFEHKMIYRLETPIVVVQNNKTKKKINFYTQDDFNKWSETANHKEYEISYKKGLAALLDDEAKEMIQNPRLTLIKTDNLSKEYLNIWFGKESELRKKELLK